MDKAEKTFKALESLLRFINDNPRMLDLIYYASYLLIGFFIYFLIKYFGEKFLNYRLWKINEKSIRVIERCNILLERIENKL